MEEVNFKDIREFDLKETLDGTEEIQVSPTEKINLKDQLDNGIAEAIEKAIQPIQDVVLTKIFRTANYYDYNRFVKGLHIHPEYIDTDIVISKVYMGKFYVRPQIERGKYSWQVVLELNELQNNIVYDLITTVKGEANVPVGTKVGYVVFSDIVNLSQINDDSFGEELNISVISSLTYSPAILSSIMPLIDMQPVTTDDIADDAVTNDKMNYEVYSSLRDLSIVYKDTIEDLWIDAQYLVNANKVNVKHFNRDIIVRAYQDSKTLWTFRQNIQSVKNGELYSIVVDEKIIGYIIFKDIEQFRSYSSTVESELVDLNLVTLPLSSRFHSPINIALSKSNKTEENYTDEDKALVQTIPNKADHDGFYPYMSVGGYVILGEELEGEIREGSLNDIGGISTPTAPRSYLLVDISHLAGTGKITVKTTYSNAYSRLWALWKTPITETIDNRVAIGPLSSESQEDVIDLSQYPDAKYLYVTIGTKGNSASSTVQQQTTNIAEKFDEIEAALPYIPNIVLPTEIEVAVGDTLNLYYKSMIESNDMGNYQVEVLCDVGQSYPRYYTFQPLTSQAGKSYTLSVSLKNDRGEQLANANTNIVVKAIPTTTTAKNILTIGASMVANGNIAYELKRRLTTTSGDGKPENPTGIGLSNISFVGRLMPADADVQQEATGGWAWRDYVSQGRQAYRFQVSGVKSINMGDVYVGGGLTFTITEINVTDGVGNIRCTYTGSGSIPTSGNLTRNKGNGDATIAYSSYASETYNPFYNDGALDIQHYADLYCNGNIDILIAVCGTNDLFTTRPIAEIMDDVKTFARAYHTAFPNGKFILSTLPLPSPIGGMGANYNATKDNYYNIALRMFGFAKGIYDMCKDNEFSSYVVGCSTLHTFDIDNLYPYVNKSVNNRMPNVTEKIGTNGVHPTIEGYKTIADALYSTVVGLL